MINIKDFDLDLKSVSYSNENEDDRITSKILCLPNTKLSACKCPGTITCCCHLDKN